MTNSLFQTGGESSGDETRIIERGESEPYYVVLPCEVKDFRSFVSGLLGKPQELKGEMQGTFTISHKEVTNIYHLLEQRMAKQNDASLVHFAISVYYDDGNSVVHNNIVDFESYHPTTKCHATGVTVSATYLIKFRGHDTPEKQEIQVAFSADPEFHQNRWFNGGLYEYRITHTERTWATDIVGLLSNHGSTVLNKLSGWRKFIRQYADSVAIGISALVIIVCVFLWANVALGKLASTTAEFESYRSFIEFVIRSIPALFMLCLMLVAVKHYVGTATFFQSGSHILFTEEDRKYSVEKNKSRTLNAIRYVLLQVFSIGTGVVSSIIYSKNWLW